MKAVAIILSIVAFVACLLVGIQAGSQSSPPTSVKATSTPNLWLSPSQQRTIPYIIADNLQNPAPRLVAVWLLLYRPDLTKVTLLPLYPGGVAGTASGESALPGAFLLSPDKSPDKKFMAALQGYHVPWNGYILTDLYGISRTVDWLQGIEYGDSTIDGPTALDSLIPPWEDLQASLETQEKIITGACKTIANIPAEANWIGLASVLSPDHLHTDLNLEMVIADWKGLVSGMEPLTCEIPVP